MDINCAKGRQKILSLWGKILNKNHNNDMSFFNGLKFKNKIVYLVMKFLEKDISRMFLLIKKKFMDLSLGI